MSAYSSSSSSLLPLRLFAAAIGVVLCLCASIPLPTLAQLTTCVQQGYDLTPLTGADLLFTGTGNTAGTGTVYNWAIRPCGAVSTPGYCRNTNSTTNVTTPQGEFCQGNTIVSNSNYTAFNSTTGTGIYNGAIWAQVNTNGQQGVAQFLQDGDGCGAFDREGTIEYLCNQTATTPFISEIIEETSCHYQAIIQTSVVCPVAALGFSKTVGTNIISSSCGGGIFDLGPLNTADIIGEIDAPNGGTNYSYLLRVCGTVVSTNGCTGTPRTSICQVPLPNNGVTGYSIATWNPALSPVVWAYTGPNQISQLLQDGAGCDNQNRFTNITFICSPTATSAKLLSLVENPQCHYNFLIQTNLVCGTPFLPTSSSSSTGRALVSSSSTGPQIPVFTNCVYQGYNLTSITGVDLFYTGTGNAAGTGTVYNWAIRPCGVVTTPGFCETTILGGQFCQGTTVVDNADFTLEGVLTGPIWAQITTNGQRGVAQFLQDGDGCGSANFDREGTIEYLCNPTATTPFISSILEITVCHYQAIIQTSVVCAVAQRGLQTQVGSTVISGVCGGGIYDLTPINNADISALINSTNGGSNYTYTIRICGTVTSNSWCSGTPFTSICQYNAAITSAFILGTWTPEQNLVAWQYNGNGVSQIIQDGAGCAGQNRLTNVTLVCDPTASVPVLQSVSEGPICHYYFTITTDAVCGPAFPAIPDYNPTCVQQGYDLTTLTTIDLYYRGTGNTAGTGTVYNWAVRPCGTVSTPGYCTSTSAGGEFCQGSTVVSNSNWNTTGVGNGPIWAQITSNGQTGVAQLLQDGDNCGSFDREGTIEYLCNATATNPFISSLLETTTCHYQVIIQTSVVCPNMQALGYSTSIGTAVISSQCGASFWDLTALNGADISGVINSRTGGTNYTYLVHLCGPISTNNCSGTTNTSVCQVPVGNQQPNAGFALAAWTPATVPVVWIYNGNGLSQIIQDGAGCAGQNRLTNVTLVCTSTATTPQLVSVVEFPTCHYTILILTNTVCGTAFLSPTATTGTMCLLSYSNPGNVDYPWSVATLVNFLYNPQPITTVSGQAVSILLGSGTRTFTNRYGIQTTTPLTIALAGTLNSDNYLYLNAPLPLSSRGITWSLASPVQLPGAGPMQTVSFIQVYNQSGIGVAEGGASRFDPTGSAFLSNVPGFNNVSVGAANFNALAANYQACQAPITFNNGLRTPTQPTAFNGATRFSYSYFISDGVSYSVQANLSITTSSQFANSRDLLGNPYQTVIGVTGTRTYTYLPTRAQVVSAVNGLSLAVNPLASQRFYPYSLLGSAPGVYSAATAPLIDNEGIEFNVSPSVPMNGLAPGRGLNYTATTVYMTTLATAAVLTDGVYTNLPLQNLQQQYYSF